MSAIGCGQTTAARAVLCFTLALGAPPAIASAAAEGGPAGVDHVVLCWLKQPGDPAAASEVIRVSRELRGIPGVRRLDAGRALPGDRPNVDDSFDVGVVMSFANPEALSAYVSHPEHVRRVRETFQPLCAKIRIHDIQY